MKRLFTSSLIGLVVLLGAPTFGLGGIIVITHANPDIGVASTSVLAAISSAKARVHIYLENDSDTTLYCKFGAAAVVNQGIRLAAAGTEGNRLIYDSHTGVPQTALNCISSGGATKRLLVVTGTQQ